MILMSAIFVILFFNGGAAPFNFLNFIPQIFWFSFKVFLILFFFVWLRATLPRYRYDQLMSLSWLKLIPFVFGYLFLVCGCLIIL
jgi:NADH-quinone oxidoreductase subunit H